MATENTPPGSDPRLLVNIFGRPQMARPKKNPADRYLTPVRQAGRIPQEEWEMIQQAAERLEMTTTQFIRETMLRRAKRVLRTPHPGASDE